MTKGIEGGVWVVPVEALRDAEARIAELEAERADEGQWNARLVSALRYYADRETFGAESATARRALGKKA